MLLISWSTHAHSSACFFQSCHNSTECAYLGSTNTDCADRTVSGQYSLVFSPQVDRAQGSRHMEWKKKGKVPLCMERTRTFLLSAVKHWSSPSWPSSFYCRTLSNMQTMMSSASYLCKASKRTVGSLGNCDVNTWSVVVDIFKMLFEILWKCLMPWRGNGVTGG